MTDKEWSAHDSAVLRSWRQEAGLTFPDLEGPMGYGRQTLSRKEASGSDVSLRDIRHLAEACGLDPNTCMSAFCAPEQDGETRKWLADYIMRSASEPFVLAMYFLCRGGHGSDPNAYAQKIIADLQCRMADRFTSARLTIGAYNMAAATDALSDPSGPRPDLELLSKAVEAGYAAAVEGRSAYQLQQSEG